VPTVEQLLGALAERDAVIEELRARVAELERRLGQNSSRAPSGDRLERSPSRAAQREAGRKPGKQPGGQGFALRRTESADTVIEHVPAVCGGCGQGLAGAPVVKVAARQVFDIPEVSTSVTEHRLGSCRCTCGQLTQAGAPTGVRSPVQYGPNLKALATYLVVYQHIPVERAAELIVEALRALQFSTRKAQYLIAAAAAIASGTISVRTLAASTDEDASQPTHCTALH